MRDLTVLKRTLETSATWMQSRRGKGVFYSNPETAQMEKNTAATRSLEKPEGQGPVAEAAMSSYVITDV
jgi:hypothetical protein